MKLIITFLLALTSFCFSQDFWEQTNGPYGGTVKCLAINSNGDIFAGTWGSGVHRSTDNGDSWIQIISDFPRAYVSSFAINSNGDIFAGYHTTLSFGGEGVYRSTDNGDNWTQIMTELSVESLVINSLNGDVFTGTRYDGVYRSTDNGDNWTETNNGLTNLDVHCLAINSSGDIFAGTEDGVYRSKDDGDNWTQMNNGLTDNHVRCLTINSNGDIFAGSNHGFFRSMDNGDNWTDNWTIWELNNFHVDCLAINSNGDIFIGTWEGGLLCITDNGDNLVQINSGLDLPISSLTINSNGYIFAGTKNGVFRSINTTVSVEEENSLPSEFTLEQNYPNPFNPSTTFKYEIPKESYVTLKVYDILGREIKTLINKEQPVSNYEVEFNATELTSGIYFYRIIAGDFVETKKMILMK